MSLLDLITDTYECNTCQDRARSPFAAQNSTQATRCGWPVNSRSQYLASHQSQQTRIRVVCSSGHQTIVNIIGKWFPHGDDSDSTDSHHASLLCLLKPWRKLSMLKGEGETWASVYEKFQNMQDLGNCTAAIIGNVQFYYDCKDATTCERSDNVTIGTQAHPDDSDEGMDDVEEADSGNKNIDWSEASLEQFLKEKNRTREVL